MHTVLKALWYYRQVLIFILAPLLYLAVPIAQGGDIGKGAYVMLLMGTYWATECIPLAVTALIPIVLFPVMGVMDSDAVGANYLNETGILAAGALICAISLEVTNINRRIALRVVLSVGDSPKWLMFGFMLPTWVLSMFINNITCVAIMMPILEQVLVELEAIRYRSADIIKQDEQLQNEFNVKTLEVANGSQQEKDKGISIIHKEGGEANDSGVVVIEPNPAQDIQKEGDEHFKNFTKALSLAIPYASNAGGITTMTGTTGSLIIKSYVDDLWSEYDLETPLNYTDWIVWGLPQAVINFAIAWVYLLIYFLGFRFFFGLSKNKEAAQGMRGTQAIVRREYEKLGPLRTEESLAAMYFVILILLWFFREPGFMDGWSSLFDIQVGISVPTMAVAILLFITPTTYRFFPCGKNEKGKEIKFLMNFKEAKPKFNWDIVFLIGGGFALADGSDKSGLSEWIGEQMAFLDQLHPVITITIYTIAVTLITQIISNNATALLLLPISQAVAENMGKSPMFLFLPLASAVQLAFLLPVANPSMAITYAYGRFEMLEWVKCGLGITILNIIPIIACVFSYGNLYFDTNTLEWDPTNSTDPATLILRDH